MCLHPQGCLRRDVRAPWSCEGKLGVLLESLQGQRDLIEACVQDLIFLSREDRDLGFPFQTPPGSQASPRGEAEDSAFLSIRDTYLLEPNEWTQGCRASSSLSLSLASGSESHDTDFKAVPRAEYLLCALRKALRLPSRLSGLYPPGALVDKTLSVL